MSIASVTGTGQVTIPKDVRDALGIREGDRLEFVVQQDGSVRIRLLRADVRNLFGMVPFDRALSVEEMDEAIARHVNGESQS